MNTAWKSLIIIALLLMKMTAFGASFSVRNTLSETSIPINGHATLTFTLSYPEGYQPDIEEMQTRLLAYNGFGEPPFTLISSHTETSGTDLQTITVTLQPMTLGKHVIGPNVATFQSKAGKNKVVIPVNSVTINVTDIASTLHFEAMVAPFLDLTPRYPLNVSYSNKVEFIDNAQVIASHAAALAAATEDKEFPWAVILAAVICAFVVTLILITPSETKAMEESEEERAKRHAAIRAALKELASSVPRNATEFLQLEISLKQLLDSEYNLNASYDTYQQLSKKIETLPPLPPALKQKLVALFATADKIKFARYEPQKDDYTAAAETASQTAQ